MQQRGQARAESEKPGINGGLAGAGPPSPGLTGSVQGPPGAPAPEVAFHLLDLIGEGVALATRSGVIVSGNDFIRRQSGAMLERLAGACRQFDRDRPLPPPSAPIPPAGNGPRTDLLLIEGDRYLELSITPDANTLPAGRSEQLVLVLRDVTPARRLQQRINAIDQAGSELVRFDPDYVRKHNAHERLKLLETKIVRVASDLLHFDHFAIRLLDDRSGKLELVIGCNLPPDFDSFVIRPALEGHGISGYVAASGRTYVCEDIASDSLYLPGVEGARSSLTVPLRLQDKVIGIMNVESLQPMAFGEEERQLGEIFARYIAVALHMLDLLVVERSTTNISITGRVATELRDPIEDIAHEVEVLRSQLAPSDASAASHLERITSDLSSIRQRLVECAAGPNTLLGVEKALSHKGPDPIIQGRHILVADDEQRIRKTIGDVLTVRGAHVTVCENGTQAIATLESSGAGAFDLVISDIRMPDHNGYEVFAAAKKHSPAAPVILMTGFGYDPHHSIVRASQEGLQTVLFKPFQVERLLDDVRKALVGKK
ncbi:C4-dicarboxylate transport transcriptional regulatory protein DctD [Phycisphaerales bacterium]|nr:C4-dicarboxylate transport transcriptional regulatory protein DctD [Phycisphaerales bacterium]